MIGHSRTIRFYFASTCRDSDEERELLVRHAFPVLRANLNDNFVERAEVLQIAWSGSIARPYVIGPLGERQKIIY